MSLDTGSGLDRSVDSLGDLFYPLFRWLFDEDGDFVDDVETKLAQARMATTVELYLSRALAVGVLLGAVLWILGTFVGYSLFAFGILSPETFSTGAHIPNEAVVAFIERIKIPAAIGILGLVAGSVGFVSGFGTLVAIPYSRASGREREINMLLSDAISFMYALSVGGLNQLEILEAMARADDTYGEVAQEFQSIVQETEYFGTDYRNAIQQQAAETPSDDLAQFLTDMLSIVNSGGNMQAFLSDKKDKHMRTAKQQQEVTLDTLELFGEMYMTLSLFPLLLIIILVIMSMLGEAQSFMLYATVYALIPITGVMFLVLVSTVKQDEPGDGYLQPASGAGNDPVADAERGGLRHLGIVEGFVGEFGIFDHIKSREGTFRTKQLLRNPHHFFRDNPTYTLALTVPAALVLLVFAGESGAAPTTWGGMVQAPVWGTFVWVYVPLYLLLIPLGVFHEWNVRARAAITGKLSDNLRKLSSANDTGQTLLESISTVADTSSGKLADEFDVVYAKVNYGMSLRNALIEFNNKYHVPRLARTVKLISKAQEASSQITQVLTTAAQASENQDDIERERRSRTRMQVAIILMTYLTLLGVMAILKTQFLDVMAGLTEQAAGGGGSGASQFGGGIDTQLLSLLFFHAVTLQAVLSGIISGYIRTAKLMAGIKFVVILQTIALAVWLVVG
ncbi:type II secretion system F family protein [Haloplanus litoreus]|uniref:Type II secretion system F family protein n=1 Tax=Haloplanus litoreus TaxID=767515 RepID=A0ABD6A1E0_9EURY